MKESIIQRVLEGTASAREQAELHEWIEQNPANREEYDDFKALWENSSGVQTPEETDLVAKGWIQICSRIGILKDKKRRVKRQRTLIAIGLFLCFAILSFVILTRELGGSYVSHRFNDAPISDVLSVVEKYYDVQISAEAQRILECRFTGSIVLGDDAAETLHLVVTSLGLQYSTVTTGKFLINGADCIQ